MSEEVRLHRDTMIMTKPTETEQLDTKYQVLIDHGHQRPSANDAKTVCAYNYITGLYAFLQLSGAVRVDSDGTRDASRA